MYKCDKCGSLKETLPAFEEYHPYGDGQASEKIIDWDCSCGGTYYEAERCPICGEYIGEDETINAVCYSCIEKYSDFKTVKNIAQNERPTEQAEINSFLIAIFGVEKIEKILFSLIDKKLKISASYNDMLYSKAIKEFIDTDRSWYAEALVRGKEQGVI